jgi:hypothetical protein
MTLNKFVERFYVKSWFWTLKNATFWFDERYVGHHITLKGLWKLWCFCFHGLIKNIRTRLGHTSLETRMVTNALTAIRLTIPKVSVMNFWDISNDGIILVIHERRIWRRPPLQQLLRYKNREYDVIERTLALVVVVDNDNGVLNISTLISNNIWIIDSCVTNHITFDSNL